MITVAPVSEKICSYPWTKSRRKADATSGSLESRRGMPVMPARRGAFIVPDEPQWIIHVCTPDPTGRSLRGMDATRASLQG